uniref:Si:ch211-193l2.10 n=1 Tax=Labrus bergylta TaxID=56723 RepID=A0A3Q3M3K9_9LABR
MRYLLMTQSQNCYREQIQKETMTRLAWKRRYAEHYPSCYNPGNTSAETTQLPHQPGKGRSLYLQRRGQIRPEERFDFPVLSSWEYGWRLGRMNTLTTKPLSNGLLLVKNTFYARNGVFNNKSATDTLG